MGKKGAKKKAKCVLRGNRLSWGKKIENGEEPFLVSLRRKRVRRRGGGGGKNGRRKSSGHGRMVRGRSDYPRVSVKGGGINEKGKGERNQAPKKKKKRKGLERSSEKTPKGRVAKKKKKKPAQKFQKKEEMRQKKKGETQRKERKKPEKKERVASTRKKGGEGPGGKKARKRKISLGTWRMFQRKGKKVKNRGDYEGKGKRKGETASRPQRDQGPPEKRMWKGTKEKKGQS